VTGSGRVQIDGALTATGTTQNGGAISGFGATLGMGKTLPVDAGGALRAGSVEMSATDLADIGGLVSANGASGGFISLEARAPSGDRRECVGFGKRRRRADST